MSNIKMEGNFLLINVYTKGNDMDNKAHKTNQGRVKEKFIVWWKKLTLPIENITMLLVTIIQFWITCNNFANANSAPINFYISFFFTSTYEICYFNKEKAKLFKDYGRGMVCYHKNRPCYKPYHCTTILGYVCIVISIMAYFFGTEINQSQQMLFAYKISELFNLLCLCLMGVIIFNHKVVTTIREILNKPKYELRNIDISMVKGD